MTLPLVNIAYDFVDDADGEYPAGWSSFGNVQIIPTLDDHNKVLEMYYSPDGDSTYNVLPDKTTGTVEYWLRTNDTAKFSIFAIWDGGIFHSISFGISSGYFGYVSNTYPAGNNLTSANADTWYHIRIEFNCSAGWWRIWIGEDYYSGYLDFLGTPSAMDRFWVGDLYNEGQLNYLDAVDYSWADGYFTNRSYEHFGKKYYNNCVWTSNAIDLEVISPYYNEISFSCNTTVNTSVYISYRMSTDNSSWDAWSAWTNETISFNTYKKRFMQVKVLLTVNNTAQTPTLFYIKVDTYMF